MVVCIANLSIILFIIMMVSILLVCMLSLAIYITLLQQKMLLREVNVELEGDHVQLGNSI